jgi:hypothetical protein
MKTHYSIDEDFIQEQPIAWAWVKDGSFYDAIHPDEHAKTQGSYTVPLYTKLQNVPLSDEEILDLWVKKNNLEGAKCIIDFARTIRGEK